MAQGGVSVRRGFGLAAVLVGLGACMGPAPRAQPPVADAVQSAPPPTPSAPAPAPPPRDACGALALQYLVGKPRSEIPVPVNPGVRRVVCSTCMVTQDYVAGRQTITYDEKTDLVLSVRCG